ncbi:MAG: autotransporter domain-containing protein [Sphingomonadales bacterium]
MKRLDNKLKVSVSLLALMSGGALLASTAHAVTISDEQSSVVITTDIDELIVETTGDVSPGGILVQGSVAGDVTNDGIIEFLDTPTAEDTDFVEADAVALEIWDGVEGDFDNASTINAMADASVSVIGDFSGDAAINEDAPSAADAFASGADLGEVDGSISNSGDITAAATADASSDLIADSGEDSAHVDGGASSYASAYGLEGDLDLIGEDDTADFTNTKDGNIKATADATSDVIADVSGDDATLFDVDGVYSDAFAMGVWLGGGDAIVNDGTIGAAATATSVFDGTATGLDGSGTIGGEDGIFAEAEAVGLYVGEDAGSIKNTGTVSADAKASGTQTAVVDGTDGGMIDAEGNVYADAYGIEADGALDSFDNTGSVTANGASSLTSTLTATSDDGATVGLEAEVGGESFGVILDELDGPFSNSGTISSTNTADLKVVADSGAADTAAGSVGVGSFVKADAWGVTIEDFDGSFTNTKDGKIVADASATSSVDLGGTGATAAASDGSAGAETITMANAIGVALTGGEDSEEDPDTNIVTNAGSITATADAASTVTLSGTSTGTGAGGSAGGFSMTGALAVGLLDMGDATGFDNSGTISATSTASHVGTLTGDGDVDSSAGGTGILYSAAVGAAFIEPIDGNVTNSGTISATASGAYDLDVASDNKTDLGDIGTGNLAGVAALGLYADVAAPVGEDDTASTFTNSGTISAKGDLKIDITQPEATEAVEPEQETLGGLIVAGAVVAGDPSTVTNSGTISATGSLNTTGIAGEDSGTAAGVVGLWLPEADDGLEISNSGKITAELSGNADESAAVGLMLGPLPDGLLGDLLGEDGAEMLGGIELEGVTNPLEEGELEAAAAGVITVDNTGTISGINKTEGGLGYGIFAETAPVPVVINQMGGTIEGTTAAIAMDQGEDGQADTLNWSGGSIKGLVDADSADVVNVIQALDKDGKGVDTTVTAGTDFELEGAGQLNIGGEDAPVTFVMNGLVTNVGETNLNTDGKLVLGPTAKIDTGTFNGSEDSTLVIQFNPTSAGLITTTGDFNADGSLQTQALAGLYGDKGSHVVIDAGGAINGEFDDVGTVGDTLLIDFTTTVNPTDVVVAWERNPFDEVDGLSDNSKSVAEVIEDSYDPDREPSDNEIELNDQLGGLFTLTDGDLYDRVLNSWSGSEHAQIMRAATNLSEPYLMAISEHLNDNRWGIKEQRVVMLRPKGSSSSIAPASSVGQGAEDSRMSFWARGFGRWADTRGDANADGFKEDTYGAVLGFDVQVSPNFLVGVAGSYVSNDLDFDDGDIGSIDRWSIGGYLSGNFDAFYVDGSFTYASDDYKVDRTILTGGTACLAYNCGVGASSKYGGDGWIAHAEAGFNWMLGDTAKLQPFAGLNYTSIDHNGFTETGGGDLGLIGLDGTGKSLQSRLGARLSGEWGSGNVRWIPEIRGEWRHEFEDNPAWIQSSLVGLPDDPFVTVGSHVGRDLAVVGAGITAQMASGWGLYFDYQGAFGSGYTSHVAQGGVRVKF